MVKEIIELMLGRSGRFLLALYDEYHFLFNAFIIVYGVLLVWAHINLRKLAIEMEKVILEIAGTSTPTLELEIIYNTFVNRWKGLSGKRKIFIPSRNDLWLTLIKPQDLIAILGIRPEYIQVVLSKAKIRDDPSIPGRVYRAWELYRHQLLIGVRSRRMEPDFQLRMKRDQIFSKDEHHR